MQSRRTAPGMVILFARHTMGVTLRATSHVHGHVFGVPSTMLTPAH